MYEVYILNADNTWSLSSRHDLLSEAMNQRIALAKDGRQCKVIAYDCAGPSRVA